MEPNTTADTAEHHAYREYLDWIESEIVPRVERELHELMHLGWVRSLDTADLWHLHIGYPEGAQAPDTERIEFHLLYHSMERPHELRQRWLDELADSRNQELRRWATDVAEQDFDYHEFFFSGRRYSRPEALSPETVARYAELWAAEDQPELPPKTKRLREYRNRISYIVGSAQPGYQQAAGELLLTSSIISRTEHPLTPTRHRYLSGYDYPVTIVFSPRVDGRPFFGVTHVIQGETLLFGVRFDIDPGEFLTGVDAAPETLQ